MGSLGCERISLREFGGLKDVLMSTIPKTLMMVSKIPCIYGIVTLVDFSVHVTSSFLLEILYYGASEEGNHF